jgi:hypothetical protein
MDNTVSKIDELSKHCKKLQCGLTIAFGAIVILFLGLLCSVLWRPTTVAGAASHDAEGILRARGLVITDDKGVERVWIGAPLPDPISNGKRWKRKDTLSGMLVYDSKGNERGGFFTEDNYGNISLTLDATDRQQAFFVADPNGGAALRVWYGKDLVDLRADEDGPTLKIVQAGKPIFQQPELPVLKK